MTSSSFDGVGNEIVDAVLQASRALVGVAARSLANAEDEVTIPQFRAMVIVAGHNGCSLNTLAMGLGVTAPTASRMCDRLCAKKLLQRDSNAKDRRQIQVQLTEKGRTLCEAVTQKRREDIGRILSAMSEDEQRLVAVSLGRFAAAAAEPIPDSSYWEI